MGEIPEVLSAIQARHRVKEARELRAKLDNDLKRLREAEAYKALPEELERINKLLFNLSESGCVQTTIAYTTSYATELAALVKAQLIARGYVVLYVPTTSGRIELRVEWGG